MSDERGTSCCAPRGRSGRGGGGDHAPAAPPRRVRRPAPAEGAPRDHARRGARRAARPSTTCSSPARPASARPRSPGIVAAEMDVSLRITSGPALERAGDLAAILTNLDDGDVLFIDEIHRLPAAGRGGALPGDGGLPARHRDRQGPVGALDPPRPARGSRSSAPPPAPASSPARCATASASSPGSTTTSPTTSSRSSSAPRASSACRSSPTGAAEIARRARGTPRIANRLLKRVRDYAEVRADGTVTADDRAATRSRCSRSTSSASTRSTGRSSRALCETFAGQPVGPRHPRGGGGRGARDGRGRLRAVPAQVRAARRTPRGRVATRGGVRPPRPAGPGARRPSLFAD